MRTTLLAALCSSLALLPSSTLTAQCVVHDLNGGPANASPTGMTTAFGQHVYFSSNLSPYGNELIQWSLASGLQLLADINPSGNSNPQGMTPCCTALGPRLFFSAFLFGQGAELWMTDGTAAGTVLVREIRPGSSGSNPASFLACDGRVFFSANDGTAGGELWVSDGTLAGTSLVADINAGAGSSLPELLACFDGKAFFTAYTPASGRELYVSDGTAAGTQMVLEIYPGTNSPSISAMVECGGKLFFYAYDNINGGELWTTDGTAAGTAVVTNIAPNSGSAAPNHLTCCGDTLFFTAQNTTYGRELWKSDGTAAGTVLVKDVRPGAQSSQPGYLACSGDRVFFAADAFTGSGVELWVSDGTAAGTFEVTDIVPGVTGSYPQEITPVATGVCFTAVDAAGYEPWFSDGTAANTFQICDIHPTGNSFPHDYRMCLGRLFFAATHPTLGIELFEVQTPGASAAVLGEGGRPSRPTLHSRDGGVPVLGTTIDVDAVGPVGGLGILVAGPSLLPGPPVPGFMQGGCDWAGANAGLSFTVTTSPLPTFSVPIVTPNQAWVTGIAFNLQVIWFVPTQTPLLEVSNGLQLVFGGPVPM